MNPGRVSQHDWLNARRALLVKENEVTKLRDAMTVPIRALPWRKEAAGQVYDNDRTGAHLDDELPGASFFLRPWQRDLPHLFNRWSRA